MRPNTKEYNEWLPELQREVAAGKDLNILGMSIPTDTTPGHLGMKRKIHQPEVLDIDIYIKYGGPVIQLVIDPSKDEIEKVANDILGNPQSVKPDITYIQCDKCGFFADEHNPLAEVIRQGKCCSDNTTFNFKGKQLKLSQTEYEAMRKWNKEHGH